MHVCARFSVAMHIETRDPETKVLRGQRALDSRASQEGTAANVLLALTVFLHEG